MVLYLRRHQRLQLSQAAQRRRTAALCQPEPRPDRRTRDEVAYSIPAAKRPACKLVWFTSPVLLLLLHDLATAPILCAAVSFVAHAFS